MTALFFVLACTDNDALPASGSAGGAGRSSASAGQGGASGARAAGASGSSAASGSGGTPSGAGSGGMLINAGSSGVAGSSGDVAGSAGAAGSAGSGDVAGSAGAGGVAGSGASSAVAGSGGSGPTSNCSAGGALFVVGNYADLAGNQFILRSAPKAATFAWVPAGVADPAKPPQLFLVNRVCAPGAALIANDGSSSYRVDFKQAGNQLAICLSAPVPTLELALLLPAADASQAASTGCSGQPFTVYNAVTL